MNKQSYWIILILILLGAAVLGYNSIYKQQLGLDVARSDASDELAQSSDPLTGLRRPDFTLKDMIGVPHELNEWDGHIIVLNFWATWCRPCLQEIPMFTDIQRSMSANGVQFIGVAVDDRATVETFLERTGIDINYPILIGDNDAIPVAVEYGNDTGILPYTVIIDAKGIITYYHYGAIDRDELESELNRLSPS
jgi:peroxiredoxin